jgi:hypothetical protein
MRRIAAGALLGLWVLAAPAARAEPQAIRVGDLRRDVKFLADDALAGRDTGEAGIRKAEEYIARQLRKAGLVPLPGREDFWIDVELYRRGYEAEGTALAVDSGGRREAAVLGADFRPFPFSSDGVVEAPVVFAGYGITAPEHDWDDYVGLDVAGKIVLVLRHEPGEKDPNSSFDGSASSRHAQFAAKAENARRHGAAAMLVVTDPLHHGPDDDLRAEGSLSLEPPRPRDGAAREEAGESDDEDEAPLLALHVGQKLGAAIAASSGATLADLQRAVDGGLAPSALGLRDVRARVAVARAADAETVPARNVGAFLEGRDPALRDEWIVVGGHHDHIGGYSGAGDTVFNGADDNASGTAGVLALARAFASHEERPRRSIAFLTFTGEEQGLLGSRALVQRELIPVERVVFMLNLDMIGRNPDRKVQLFGDGYSRGLREIVEEANRDVGLPLEFGGASYAGNSDHDPFYERAVPFMFFFTGVHEDYHQPGDHAEKLDYERMQSILEVAHGVIERLAEADAPPGFVHHIGWLGARVEVLGDRGAEQAVVTGVDEGSRAARADLREGDVIAAIGDEALESPRAVGRRFDGIEPGTSARLSLRRAGEPHALTVERAKPGYMGVSPAPIDDDRRAALGLAPDEGLLLREVSADGPSAKGGLEAGDVVIRIAGRPVGTADLGRRLAQIGAGETVEITVIRAGERRTLSVTLGERPSRR